MQEEKEEKYDKFIIFSARVFLVVMIILIFFNGR